MSDNSKIEWTEATWNPVRGCVKVSPGCAHCYAETFAERFRGVPGHPYEQGFDLRMVPEKLTEPLRWKKPKRIFVNSMSDLFQDGVPDSYIDQVLAVMALAPQHTFQVLTKRAGRMRDYFASPDVLERVELQLWERHTDDTTNAISAWPLPNVWLGVSVENQHFADERIPLLLQTPAAVRFISAEPLLGPIDLYAGGEQFIGTCEECGSSTEEDSICDVCQGMRGLDWVIVGGESGHGARPFDLAWARFIVNQCKAAGVACFVKQLGNVPVMDEQEWRRSGGCLLNHRNNRREPAGTVPLFFTKKGGDPSEWPEDLRVREFPKGIA